MKTFKYILLAVFFSLTVSPVIAQGNFEEKMEKFKTERIEFITTQLELTSKEAALFWPVYNEFDSKRQAINKAKMKLVRQYQANNTTITETEASDMADKFIGFQKQEALLAEEFNVKFKAVIPATKVLKLYQSEIQFKRKLLKQLRQKDN